MVLDFNKQFEPTFLTLVSVKLLDIFNETSGLLSLFFLFETFEEKSRRRIDRYGDFRVDICTDYFKSRRLTADLDLQCTLKERKSQCQTYIITQ